METLHGNGLSGLLTLSAFVQCLHFKKLHDSYGGFCGFGVPFVIGPVNTGKTVAASMALAALGLGNKSLYKRLVPRKMVQMAASSTMPFVVDDIECVDVVMQETIIQFYNRGIDATCHNLTEPQTAPLITANSENLRRMREKRITSRMLIIPFEDTVRTFSEQYKLDEERGEVMGISHNALPVLVKLGETYGTRETSTTIKRTYTQRVRDILERLGVDVEDRLHRTYAYLLYTAEQILEIAGLSTKSPTYDVWAYFGEKIAKHLECNET